MKIRIKRIAIKHVILEDVQLEVSLSLKECVALGRIVLKAGRQHARRKIRYAGSNTNK